MKKLSLNHIEKTAQQVIHWLKRYSLIIGIILTAFLYAGLLLQINAFNRREPTDDAVTEKLQTIKRPKVDQSVVDKLQKLQDNSTDVQALFKAARDNPFQE